MTMTISKEVLDELLKDCKRPDDLLGESGLMKELRIKLMERMLGAELTAHLGYEAGQEAPPDQANRRNGSSAKVLKGQDGEIPISVPRDRDGSFLPELVKKGQTRIDGMDAKIIRCPAGDLRSKSAERGSLCRWFDRSRHPRPPRRRLWIAGLARSPSRAFLRNTLPGSGSAA
jgi:transposase-like protein